MGKTRFTSFKFYYGHTQNNILDLTTLRFLGQATLSYPVISLSEYNILRSIGTGLITIFSNGVPTDNYYAMASILQFGANRMLYALPQRTGTWSSNCLAWKQYFLVNTDLTDEAVLGAQLFDLVSPEEVGTQSARDVVIATYDGANYGVSIKLHSYNSYTCTGYQGKMFDMNSGAPVSMMSNANSCPSFPYLQISNSTPSSSITANINSGEMECPILVQLEDGTYRYWQMTSRGYIDNSGGRLRWGDGYTNTYQANLMLADFYLQAPERPNPNPDSNDEGGTTETGGGIGTFDNTSDTIDINELPTLNAVDTGFTTIYNPTRGQLAALASYMWSDLFSLDTLKKLFVDPMDIILGLNIVPVVVPDGGSREVKVGGLSSGVSMNVAAQQYVTVDCGSISIEEYWGSALDYSPYTQFQLYLPYIGCVTLNTDDVMGRVMHIVYKVDILSGACMAQVKLTGGTHSQVNAVLYHYSGQCAQNIPVTGQNFSELISSVVSVATTAISAGVGGAAIGAAEGAAMSALDSAYSSGQIDANTYGPEAKAIHGEANAHRAQNISHAINNVVSNVMGCKPQINHTGSISASSGMFGVQTPYLIAIRPRQSLASNYKHYVGYPANIFSSLSDILGFTVFEKIELKNMSCSDGELAEIYELLYGGVYF